MDHNTKPWLDDLSEEWVLPAPSADVEHADSPSPEQSSQMIPPKPQSRLPRMRQSSGSFSEIHVRQITKDLKPAKRRSALAERSLSDHNIASPLCSDTGTVACAPESYPASLSGSVICNRTVEQKPKGPTTAKQNNTHETPEWRRRLLKGDIGYGDQKDLFSPMGLENIFQKPTGEASGSQRQRKSKLGLLKGLNAMPSSPPPWSSGGVGQDMEESIDGRDIQTDLDQDVSNAQDLDHSDMFSATEAKGESFGDSSQIRHQQGQVRTISGQIEFENENFSPVYLTTNLNIGHNATPGPNFTGSQLANRLRHIGTPPTVNIQTALEEASNPQIREDSSFSKLQDVSLPEDLPAGTPDLPDVGRFVELRRGGYSRDGSFRRRPLSPSPQAKIATRESSTHIPEPRSPPKSPITPQRQRPSERLSPERAQTSGSPLKLFDAHDTFTSNRLQRRLSQLEYRSEKTTSSSHVAESTKVVQKTSRLTSVEELSIQGSPFAVTNDNLTRPTKPDSARVESFGQGELDEYPFPDEISMISSLVSQLDDSARDGSPSIEIAPPGSREPLHFQYDGSPQSLKAVRAKRQGLTRVSSGFRKSSHTMPSLSRESSHSMSQPQSESPEQEYAENKRGPTSPFKNPTPKRRRTLQAVDPDEEGAEQSAVKSTKDSHIAMQSVIGKKRKDARHEHSMNLADPDVLARRQILRPRNPTPSQRRRDEVHAEIMEATEAFILSSPKLNTIREQLDSSINPDMISEESKAAAVAAEIAAFTMNRSAVVRDESRKRSVTTQDFLDEAVKIMDYIRTKGRPTSGLGSLEESESETPILPEASAPPSSPLTFSRPPSREGRLSGWREPNKRELDPTMINHLRQYQDKESDEFMGSSFRSLHLPQRGPTISQDENSIVAEQDNIRITDNLDRLNRDPIGEDSGPDTQTKTNGTHPSTGSSIGQTVVTSASRRSDNVTTIAAERVAHLIPEQVAGMSFDREKNMWVRRKNPTKEHLIQEDVSNTHDSEDDPLGNIPDLTVDETAEYLMNNASPMKPTAETFLEESGHVDEVDDADNARPTTREGCSIPPADSSSVPSKISNFAWSFPKTETRATSWSDQQTQRGSTQKLQQAPTTYSIPESDEVDVEHEIQYFEGRGVAEPPVQNAKIRDITFSIEEHDFGIAIGQEMPKRSPRRWGYSTTKKAAPRAATTTRAKTLPHGKKPVLGQRGEHHLLEDSSRNYRMQLSMSVTAPALGVQDQEALIPAPSSPVKGDVTFMLSDLPDFTLHQVDECELPDRVVVRHDGIGFSKALEDRYAQGTADLVKALQDVKPDEPYWEDLREIELHGRGLTNLHRLDEFCHRLEALDVSDNRINQVKGIPYTLRRLRAENNFLNGLTSWASLMNLQHLDVSGNEIDTLDGLSELVHLRTLKIDNNCVKSLQGIFHLDGLIELSAAGNRIESIDFASANMTSLTDLDLHDNNIADVRNLHHLKQLRHLDLDDNQLERFPAYDVPARPCYMLKSVRICRNRMTSMDIEGHCPNLDSIYVDGNSLSQISGVERLRHLRTISAREQSVSTTIDLYSPSGGLLSNPDIRSLNLSMNQMRSLNVSQHLMNLQRLELASMGLHELPEDLGQLVPNIRSINLNFNAIKDLRPLLNIKRLDELLAAGNRIGRLRTNLAVLGKLTTLRKIDLRENPLTLRFYAPTSENRVVTLRHKPAPENEEERFILPDGDIDADKQYLERLDFETRLRRRVQEILLCTNCKNLEVLDGLPFDRERILVKDEIWERLLYLGVVKKSEGDRNEN